jgi:hypothetical protein
MDRVIYLCLKLAVDKQTSLLELLVTNEITVGKLADGKPSFNGHFPAAPASTPCIYIYTCHPIFVSTNQSQSQQKKKKLYFDLQNPASHYSKSSVFSNGSH